MDDPVVELAGVALDAQDELRSALVELLEVEGLDPAAVRRHEAARLARDEAALALGLAVLRTLRSGAEVRLVVEVEPSTAVEVEELPEEEAPEEEAPEEEEPEDEDLATEEVGRQPPDLSLFKNFPLGGSDGQRNLQLRVEAFNVFNHAQFSSFNNGVTFNIAQNFSDFLTRQTANAAYVQNVRGTTLQGNPRLGGGLGEYNGLSGSVSGNRIIQLAVKIFF